MLHTKGFESQVASKSALIASVKSVRALREAGSAARGSKVLPELLGHVLRTGNFLNEGSVRGGAHGQHGGGGGGRRGGGGGSSGGRRRERCGRC